ncbi:phosphoribosylformylglycinamidine synthase subunit PurS [Companilactobacillus mindensis DSM 14500]|jgi:phosphoribosylformylglycinamidine synthase, purS protein|uniref:Phosphoribosylformylglycinamidine synthase subunit PurS n=1 Tax=Companilactobacillus mindensis DSM 14500 TaxID=1423770 RepID=A0A0R1QMZ1_9LACO|nr:phosphoribosylformylglycinamidine synthase subunit PurS [Companilactobacillus mindensis]KRL46135.1 phosphoribosylformylglycinamidine synthase subunit PurS [Companilactobacillus mindensis DSM 14500]GEO78584.1 phosphoribosylformylglycinamidine synthase subunit PurS [Companilactobacillus mindensis]
MKLVKVYVTLKKSVLDAQGEAIKSAINTMGYDKVSDVHMGKYFELSFPDDYAELEKDVDTICDDLLANPNIETYRYEIAEAE